MATLRDALVTVDSLTIVVAVLKRAMMLNLPIVLTLTDFLRTVLTDSRVMMRSCHDPTRAGSTALSTSTRWT